MESGKVRKVTITSSVARILNIMIPKPDIPEDIALNYKLVKVQWTEQLVSIQKQKTERIKKETEKIKVVIAF
jgi:hypothetical protein